VSNVKGKPFKGKLPGSSGTKSHSQLRRKENFEPLGHKENPTRLGGMPGPREVSDQRNKGADHWRSGDVGGQYGHKFGGQKRSLIVRL